MFKTLLKTTFFLCVTVQIPLNVCIPQLTPLKTMSEKKKIILETVEQLKPFLSNIKIALGKFTLQRTKTGEYIFRMKISAKKMKRIGVEVFSLSNEKILINYEFNTEVLEIRTVRNTNEISAN